MYKIMAFVIGMLAFQVSASDWNLDTSGKVIQGYDPISFFEQNKPLLGLSDVVYQWDGVDWYFASQSNLELFKANPKKYAPQFGGYCANGLSDGHKVPGNPKNWRIIDGKLYLFFSSWGRLQWAINVPKQIQLATENWQKLKSE